MPDTVKNDQINIFLKKCALKAENAQYYIGIDQAGKGDLIGNMFVVAWCARISFIRAHAHLIRDSKKCTRAQVRKLAPFLIKNTMHTVIQYTPMQIDTHNINQLLARACARACAKYAYLRAQVQIDCPSSSINKFYARMQCARSNYYEWKKHTHARISGALRIRSSTYTIVATHNAQSYFKAVAGASIIAKHYRQQHMRALKKIYNIGSGSPADKITIDFARKHAKNMLIRKKWKIKKI